MGVLSYPSSNKDKEEGSIVREYIFIFRLSVRSYSLSMQYVYLVLFFSPDSHAFLFYSRRFPLNDTSVPYHLRIDAALGLGLYPDLISGCTKMSSLFSYAL